jgi:hypothetical protein
MLGMHFAHVDHLWSHPSGARMPGRAAAPPRGSGRFLGCPPGPAAGRTCSDAHGNETVPRPALRWPLRACAVRRGSGGATAAGLKTHLVSTPATVRTARGVKQTPRCPRLDWSNRCQIGRASPDATTREVPMRSALRLVLLVLVVLAILVIGGAGGLAVADQAGPGGNGPVAAQAGPSGPVLPGEVTRPSTLRPTRDPGHPKASIKARAVHGGRRT